MSERVASVELTAREQRIIKALREVPPSPLKDLLDETLERLLDFACEPRCPEMQADGVPCDSPDADCEQCTRIREILAGLAAQAAPR